MPATHTCRLQVAAARCTFAVNIDYHSGKLCAASSAAGAVTGTAARGGLPRTLREQSTKANLQTEIGLGNVTTVAHSTVTPLSRAARVPPQLIPPQLKVSTEGSLRLVAPQEPARTGAVARRVLRQVQGGPRRRRGLRRGGVVPAAARW